MYISYDIPYTTGLEATLFEHDECVNSIYISFRESESRSGIDTVHIQEFARLSNGKLVNAYWRRFPISIPDSDFRGRCNLDLLSILQRTTRETVDMTYDIFVEYGIWNMNVV